LRIEHWLVVLLLGLLLQVLGGELDLLVLLILLGSMVLKFLR
jgi:hypothetical protein